MKPKKRDLLAQVKELSEKVFYLETRLSMIEYDLSDFNAWKNEVFSKHMVIKAGEVTGDAHV